MSKRANQFELRTVGEEFNLVTETGEDPLRVMMDKLREAEERAAAREYELKMQRVFSDCPGFIGGDAPKSEISRGSVIVKPDCVTDAVRWLRKRFHVADTVEVDLALEGVRVDIVPRVRVRKGTTRKAVKVDFGATVQFDLPL